MTDLDLTTPQRVHVIGIGGAGMRAIASVLAAMGHTVSGSDLKASSGLDRLAAEGITVHVGHAEDQVGDVDFVTRSTAVGDRNPEVRSALARGIPVLSRADVLTALTHVRPTVAVAGTHGKTTTASMLAVVLVHAGLEPSFIIGGDVNEIGSGAVWSDSDTAFVVEADESDGTFLRLHSAAAIVTSVEPDHLGHYGGEEALRRSFESFVAAVDGPTVVCVDDPGARALLTGDDVHGYGTDPSAEYRISDVESGRTSATFSLRGPQGELGSFTIASPGLHNVRNAAGAVAMALLLGAEVDDVRKGLARFAGVARRFQFRGSRDGVAFIDDYAHLPGEVSAALDAAGGGGWDRVVCVFQPHRYTRTADLGNQFGSCFEGADEVIVTGIYSAGETPIPGVSAKLVVDAIRAHQPAASVHLIEHRDDLVEHLRSALRAGDLCLTLGAGDLTTLPDELLRR